jgi:hypothetical protein
MKVVGDLICRVSRPDFEENIPALREAVKALTAKYPIYTK